MLRPLLLFAALAVGSTAHALDVAVIPDCPGPDVPVGIIAGPSADVPGLAGGKVTFTRAGNRIKVLLDANPNSISGPPTSRQVNFGTLPEGAYRVDVFYRYPPVTADPAPEQFGGFAEFNVSVASPGTAACSPATLTVVQGAFQGNGKALAFPDPIRVLATDAQKRPVPNATLTVSRWGTTTPDVPSAVFQPATATTDANGVATFTATANQVAGVAQYAIESTRGSHVVRTFVVLRNTGDGQVMEPWVTPMVGYWSEERHHFFMTSNPEEMAILDGKPREEWMRTEVFLVYRTDFGGLPPRSVGVCRFYGLPEKGLDSHFFTAVKLECDEVKEKFAGTWILETDNAFRVLPPEYWPPYPCLNNLRPLYRLFNNRTDANHVYTTDPVVRDQLVAHGYTLEGWGYNDAAMCVPR